MFRRKWLLFVSLPLVCFTVSISQADTTAQEDLDKATEIKLNARTFSDLGEVIRLADSALQKGLDETNGVFAKNLLAATLIQRAQETTNHIFADLASMDDFRRRRQFAQDDLDRAVKLDPKQPQAYLLLAQLHMFPGGGGAKAVREALDKALELGIDDPLARVKALTMRAELQEQPDKQLADNKEALAILEKLHELEPDNAVVLEQLGSLYTVLKHNRKAIEVFSDLLQAEPEHSVALRGRGDAYLNIGKHAEALADYEKALKLEPRDYGLLNNLAWLLATSPDEKIRDGRRAIELATEACRLTEYQLPHILSTLAAAYAETGDFDSAVKWSSKAVEMNDPRHGEELKKELESFKARKPWRELLTEEPEPPQPEKPAEVK
jgi:tetratricopeptide (TPR) repeat protein